MMGATFTIGWVPRSPLHHYCLGMDSDNRNRARHRSADLGGFSKPQIRKAVPGTFSFSFYFVINLTSFNLLSFAETLAKLSIATLPSHESTPKTVGDLFGVYAFVRFFAVYKWTLPKPPISSSVYSNGNSCRIFEMSLIVSPADSIIFVSQYPNRFLFSG